MSYSLSHAQKLKSQQEEKDSLIRSTVIDIYHELRGVPDENFEDYLVNFIGPKYKDQVAQDYDTVLKLVRGERIGSLWDESVFKDIFKTKTLDVGLLSRQANTLHIHVRRKGEKHGVRFHLDLDNYKNQDLSFLSEYVNGSQNIPLFLEYLENHF
jgi:hypothetical protein